MSHLTEREVFVELAFRLGVPTFILVVGLFTLLPRIDRGILIAERVDAYMTVLVSSCMESRLESGSPIVRVHDAGARNVGLAAYASKSL